MAQNRNDSRIDRLFTVEEQRKTFGFIGVALLGGLGAYLASKGLKKVQTKNYYLDAADPSKAAYYAERMYAAFQWGITTGGTDEDEVFAVLSEIPDKRMWQAVQKAYENEHGVALVKELVAELDTEEYATALAIIKTRGLA